MSNPNAIGGLPLLHELQQHAPPLAWVDASGAVQWCSAAFGSLFGATAEPAPLAALVGESAAQALLAGDETTVEPAGSPWRLRAVASAGGWLVSAQSLAEVQALRERLDLVQEFTRTGVFERDPRTMQGQWDRQMFEIWGLPAQPQGQAPAYEETRSLMFSEDTRPGAYGATLQRPGPHRQRVRIRRPDGQVRQLNTQWKVQFDAQQQALRVLGVNTDVTEAFELGQRAAQLSAELDVALKVSGIGLWHLDFDEGRVVPDERGCEIIGVPYTPEGITLAQARARIHPDDAAQADASAEKTLRTGEPTDMQLRYPAPGGGWRHVMLRRALQTDPDGKPLRFVGVLMDVTDQQQTLSQLRETIERSSLTTRALGLGTWSSDIAREHVVWDAQMFRLRGIDSPAREISVQERRGLVHPDDREGVIAAQNAHVRDGESWRDVFRVCWPDGQVRWITSHSMPLRDEHGNIERRIGVNWDSTDVHLAAQALRERELAVAESQAKSQAMSRISHELRTPLNAILGFTQLLRGGGGDAARRADWLALVEDAGQHLLALIDDVLELSRAQVGQIKLVSEAVACQTVVGEALALLAGQAQQHKVALRPQALGEVVRADPLRLRQVVVNLVSNAIKYNRPGGEVRVWSETADERVLLHVADSGFGIPTERLQDAFEPFNRLGAEGSGVEGTGIGLAIVKVLVELMGGQISAHSQPGVGSRFSVSLPAAPASAMATPQAADGAMPPATAPLVGGAQARVLYIEDNPVNALLVREMLALRPALTLHVAEDGASGIRIATELQPALVLIDMQLPDMDGHAVLRALRADPRTAALPCVVLSANATAADLQAAADAGFADYWTKPINLRHFLEGVDRFVGPAASGTP